MTLRVSTYYIGDYLLLLVLLLLSACSPSTQEGGDGMVSLTVKAETSSSNEASATLPDKEKNIYDLTVYIFNDQGNTIGYASKTFSNGVASSVTVPTRQASGCTLVTIANAIKQNGGTSPFVGVSTLADLRKQYHTFSGVSDIMNEDCLMMVGQKTNVTTSTAKSSISLQRLASRLDFTITVNQDKGTGFPIVVDSYQLCHAPLSAFYAPADMSSTGITLPSGTSFVEYAANSTAFNSWTSGSNSQSYTAYVYANPATTATDATYLLIKAHSQVSPTDTRKIWQSKFKVYLTGITGLAAYQLLPNYHYTIGISVQGSATEHNGVKTVYTAYPYYSSSLSAWGSDENKDLDMK